MNGTEEAVSVCTVSCLDLKSVKIFFKYDISSEVSSFPRHTLTPEHRGSTATSRSNALTSKCNGHTRVGTGFLNNLLDTIIKKLQ